MGVGASVSIEPELAPPIAQVSALALAHKLRMIEPLSLPPTRKFTHERERRRARARQRDRDLGQHVRLELQSYRREAYM